MVAAGCIGRCRLAADMINHLDWDLPLLDAFAPSVLANPWGWGTPMEVLSGSHAFELHDGNRHALFAVKPVVREHGTRLDITGLVSTGDRLNAADLDAAMVNIAYRFNARALAFATLRPHIATSAKRMGWSSAGELLTKRLDLQ